MVSACQITDFSFSKSLINSTLKRKAKVEFVAVQISRSWVVVLVLRLTILRIFPCNFFASYKDGFFHVLSVVQIILFFSSTHWLLTVPLSKAKLYMYV